MEVKLTDVEARTGWLYAAVYLLERYYLQYKMCFRVISVDVYANCERQYLDVLFFFYYHELFVLNRQPKLEYYSTVSTCAMITSCVRIAVQVIFVIATLGRKLLLVYCTKPYPISFYFFASITGSVFTDFIHRCLIPEAFEFFMHATRFREFKILTTRSTVPKRFTFILFILNLSSKRIFIYLYLNIHIFVF